MRFVRIEKWLDVCRGLMQNDWDNVILFTGEVGMGKSTVMYQVLSALDASFNTDRCHFTIGDFLSHTPRSTPRFGASALDEAHISGRKAMHGEMQRLNDYLQVCRGLNHHIGLCFHQENRVDKPIMERVRWNVHIPTRGVMQLRVLKKRRLRPGESPWRVVDAWRFDENKGAEWRRYMAKKKAHMMKLAGEPEDEGRPMGVDEAALDEGVRGILAAIQ